MSEEHPRRRRALGWGFVPIELDSTAGPWVPGGKQASKTTVWGETPQMRALRSPPESNGPAIRLVSENGDLTTWDRVGCPTRDSCRAHSRFKPIDGEGNYTFGGWWCDCSADTEARAAPEPARDWTALADAILLTAIYGSHCQSDSEPLLRAQFAKKLIYYGWDETNDRRRIPPQFRF